jgi:RHS repeat-associated protein
MATKHEAASWTYYTWDVDESLKKIEAPIVTLENKYNSRMQRVWRSEDGAAESLIYDSQKLIAEASSGSLNQYYLSEGGSVFSPLVSQLGSQHWFLFDALGTTLGLTAEGGGLSDTFLYEAFGTSLGRTGATATPYQYVGGYGYHTTNFGLCNAWHRWYMRHDSRWVTRDPFLDTANLYIYVDGMATALVDPMGLEGSQPQPACPCGYTEFIDRQDWYYKYAALTAANLMPPPGIKPVQRPYVSCRFDIYRVHVITGTERCVTRRGILWQRPINKSWQTNIGSYQTGAFPDLQQPYDPVNPGFDPVSLCTSAGLKHFGPSVPVVVR